MHWRVKINDGYRVRKWQLFNGFKSEKYLRENRFASRASYFPGQKEIQESIAEKLDRKSHQVAGSEGIRV